MTTRNLPLYYKTSDGSYAQMQYTDTDSFSTLNSIYPVGSVYICVHDTHPANLFGGSWAEVPKEYYLMACGTSYTRGINGKGGSNTVAAHSHGLGSGYSKFVITNNKTTLYHWKFTENWNSNFWEYPTTSSWHSAGAKETTVDSGMSLGGSTDSGGGHTNMPAYFPVRVWYRTA